MNFRYLHFITYYRYVCEPILIQQVTIDREWTGYSHTYVCHFGKFTRIQDTGKNHTDTGR